MKSALFLFCSLAAAGCYRYVPTDHTSLSAGTQVSVDLTSTGTVHVKPSIGDNVTSLEGSITEATGSGITLALLAVRRRGNVNPSTWSGEAIHLLPEDIDRVRRQELSRGRTTVASVAFGAVGVGIVYALARAVGLISVSGTPRGPPPPP